MAHEIDLSNSAAQRNHTGTQLTIIEDVPTPTFGAPKLNPDGISVKGCSIIYAPAGQAGEYSPLAANPYRGCGHKCAYCLTGDALILMSDGSTRSMRDVQVGDFIVGVIGDKLQTTEVLAKLKTYKRSIKIKFVSGRSVTCSSDHRWLVNGEWKHTGEIIPGDRILTACGSHAVPIESRPYRIGYLAGIIRGDGCRGIYDYSHLRRASGKTMGIQHRFRLAMKDKVAVDRSQSYLAACGITTRSFMFKHGSTRLPLHAIGTTSPKRLAAIDRLMVPTDDAEWERGWLAGIFDAEGGYNGRVIRIHNTDADMLETTETALTRFGFRFVREGPRPNGCMATRILGGRGECYRFWSLVNPAIKRKFKAIGQLRKSDQVTSIEDTGQTLPMFDITTGTETFIANGLVSHNCYVPNVLRMPRTEFDAGAVPRADYLKHLIKDAQKYRAIGSTEQVMLSFTTDPYHPGDNTLTRQTLQALIDHGMGICTLTKGGHRALRDFGLFRPDRDAFASTLTSLDEKFSMQWERGATLPADRIATLKRFHDAGIFTWVSLEPVLDTAATLEIIRQTHQFVDLFKVGRVNYVGLTKTTDWEQFTHDVLAVLAETGAKHYIKRDLQPYLPPGYPNPVRVPQHH